LKKLSTNALFFLKYQFCYLKKSSQPSIWPNHAMPTRGPIFFLSLMGWTTSHSPHASGKKMTHYLHQQTTRHLAIVVAKYSVLCFLPKKNHLQPIFGSKHLGNTIETLLNQSMSMKSIKKPL